jgi:uncharacterized membrane protein (UPF0127 family)
MFWMVPTNVLMTIALIFIGMLTALAIPLSRASEESLVAITTPAGATILAELADTAEKRAKGLMFRDSLPKNRGMLFTFAEAQPWTFWMKNTRLSLDIIWMDGTKTIVHIEPNVPSCHRTDDGCPQYQPNDKAMYVLELGAGAAESFHLRRGSKLKFRLPGRS